MEFTNVSKAFTYANLCGSGTKTKVLTPDVIEAIRPISPKFITTTKPPKIPETPISTLHR